jgi:hypothetical protein
MYNRVASGECGIEIARMLCGGLAATRIESARAALNRSVTRKRFATNSTIAVYSAVGDWTRTEHHAEAQEERVAENEVDHAARL